MEDEEKKEVMVEKPKRSTKSKVTTVFLCIALFCVLSILIFAIFGSDLLPFNQGGDTTPKQEEKKEETKTEPIKYELKTVEGGDELYVNSKKVAISDLVTQKERIFNVNDELILVGDCKSLCDWYFVDKDANVLGTLGTVKNTTIQRTVLVVPKFDNVEVEKVEGKDIYFYDYGFSYQDGSSLCDVNDNEVVYLNEKITYLGSANFSEKTTVSSKTRAQIMKEDQRFVCE